MSLAIYWTRQYR